MFHIWSGMPVPSEGDSEDKLRFSVLIPFRNEAERIAPLIASLKQLNYPYQFFEILFIDDHSEDGTASLIEAGMPAVMDWKLVDLPTGLSGKKTALEFGVERAAHDHVITTDADCLVSPDWLDAFNSSFQRFDPVFISGPVSLTYNPRSLTQVFQYFEQTELTALGGISIALHKPTMCNGANMGYTKQAFLEVGGYQGNKHIPTGDDQYLLKKMADVFPRRIFFMRTAKALVTTGAENRWDRMISQRIRWASKWRISGVWVAILAVLVAMANFGQLILGAYLLFVAPDSLFAKTGKGILIYWPVIQVLYPFYALVIAAKSSLGTYSWKGRQYSVTG
ncbi:MAG: glycosyltransferase [Cyclobacteriaceae bacterium]